MLLLHDVRTENGFVRTRRVFKPDGNPELEKFGVTLVTSRLVACVRAFKSLSGDTRVIIYSVTARQPYFAPRNALD